MRAAKDRRSAARLAVSKLERVTAEHVWNAAEKLRAGAHHKFGPSSLGFSSSVYKQPTQDPREAITSDQVTCLLLGVKQTSLPAPSLSKNLRTPVQFASRIFHIKFAHTHSPTRDERFWGYPLLNRALRR